MKTAALLLAALVNDPVSGDGAWEKLADAPKDLAGREMPPGLDGAWTYVPEWKGFLLFGGASPTYSNEGWFFDPDKKAWTLLWAHDALAHDGKEWRVLLPRDIVWSVDRPSPARLSGAAHDGKRVYLAGGHPAIGHKNDGRHDRSLFFGPGKLGTWILSGGQFKHVTDDGPSGPTWMVYDKAHQMLVTAPDKQGGLWTLSLAGGGWQRRPVQGPTPHGHAGWTYDASVKKCVYFVNGETWIYDAGANAWKNAQAAGAPPNRHHAAFCFDEASGRTILHGGVLGKHQVSGSSWEPALEAKCFGDTWAYDAARNEWREIRPPGAPPAAFSSRTLFAYDPDRRMCVLYDVALGVYAYRSGGAVRVEAKPPGLAPEKSRPFPKNPPSDPQTAAWQQKIRSIPDNSWFDPGVEVPIQGCMNITYDPKNRCIPQIGGCGGALYSTWDDYSYHNQIWLFDMDAGRFYLRRAHHAWGPLTPEFNSLRLAAGCSRTAGFDGTRGVIWAMGGNGTPLLRLSRAIRAYDVAADRCSPAGPASPKGGDGENEQLIYDPRNDVVVLPDTRMRKRTYLYQPKTNTWLDGGPIPAVDHPDLWGYSHIVYDPEVGVIMIGMTGGKMKTWAYNVAARGWRDLAPRGSEILPACDLPGIAYDSRNRVVLFVKSDHGDTRSRGPQPYGSLYILDLGTNAWKEGPPSPFKGKLANGSMVYDPNHNLTVTVGGFQGRYYFYRYKGGCPADAFKPLAAK
jgi:hypothetical protein